MYKKVSVYGTSTCPYCMRVKEFLKENNIVFEDLDVAKDKLKRDEMISRSKQMGVPVIDIDGEIVVGFDKQKLEELLGLM